MKNLSTINVSKAFKKVLSVTALLAFLLVANNVKANDTGDRVKSPSVEVKYLGTVNYKPVFQIAFDNIEGNEVFLSLKDENGNTFYSESTKDKKFSKKFQFDNADVSGVRITLSLRSKKGYTSQVFEISKSIRQVEDVVIAQIK